LGLPYTQVPVDPDGPNNIMELESGDLWNSFKKLFTAEYWQKPPNTQTTSSGLPGSGGAYPMDPSGRMVPQSFMPGGTLPTYIPPPTSVLPQGFGGGGGGGFGGGAYGMSAGGRSLPALPTTPAAPPASTGPGPVPMMATPNIGLSLLSSIGEAFTPRAVTKEVSPGLNKGIAGPIQNVGAKTPSFFSRFTSFFKKDVPATTAESINNSISKPLQNTGNKAPGFLSGITNFFSKGIPAAAKPTLETTVPTSFGVLNRMASSRLSPITGILSGFGLASKKPLETDMPKQFGSLKTKATGHIGEIGSSIFGIPGKTKKAIETDIPSQFSEASKASTNSVGSVMQSFINISRYVSNNLVSAMRAAFSSISSMGTTAANGIANSFSRIGSNVGAGVRGAINSAIAAAKQLSISSPERLFGLRVPDWARGTFRPFENLAYLNKGGVVPGMGNTDTVPAMLTPGEFVIRKFAVQNFGIENLKAINEGNYAALKNTSGTSSAGLSGSVYNYSLSVNVKSDANPDQIARTVIDQIKTVDSQRIRGNRF
jgi:hypothetical protein